MNWLGVAKKDVLDAHRTWTLGFASAFFVLVLAVPTYAAVRYPGESDFFSAVGIVLFLVPLVALMLSYDSIAGERELGSLKLLLGLPYTRLDVVAGTALGRITVVATASLAGIVVAALVFVAFGGTVEIVDLLVFAALVVLLGAAYAGSAVGVSAASATGTRAMATCVVFFLVTMSWSSIPRLVRYALDGFSMPSGPTPEWAVLFKALGPIDAYSIVIAELRETTGAVVQSGDAFYHTEWFAVVVLICWAIGPVVLGYYQFDGADL